MVKVPAIEFIFMMVGVLVSLAQSAMISRVAYSNVQGSISAAIFIGIILTIIGIGGLIALFFLVHVFAVFNPDNRALFKAMFSSGRVPFDWARESMAGYVKRIQEN